MNDVLNAPIVAPADIEARSMAIIREELRQQGIVLDPVSEPVVVRVIHTSADFDYAKNLVLSDDAVRSGIEALGAGCAIVTDTNMARAGVSVRALEQLGGSCLCYMGDVTVRKVARERGVTRAVVSMERAAVEHPRAVYAIGNAPTALLELCRQIEEGLRPSLVIGVPVGFVNVVESKERAIEVCTAADVPFIVARGRKGGSTIAAAICNALLYIATDTLDPARRA